jgi:probable phosphomutase (TIGR03848 family)
MIRTLIARLWRTFQTPMTRILLIRHAVNDFVKTGRLAGWTPEVHLNEEGVAQAAALGQRLASQRLHALYSSPLERTIETAEAIAVHHAGLEIRREPGIGEVRYGDWQGQSIAALRMRKMWQVVQETPSRAVFPNGEAMREVQARAVATIERLTVAHPRETIAIVSHADIIKMVMAHYMGVHLDMFQRFDIAPASISIIALGFNRPFIVTVNDTAHIQQIERDRRADKQPSAQQDAHKQA